MDNDGKKRIFDCFIFFNEIELLQLRLRELYDEVDYFVVCESPVTFTGLQKPLHFADHRELFQQYSSKIRHVIVDDMPQTRSPWDREYHQRSAIRRALFDMRPRDVVMVSDADEIIAPSTVRYVRAHDGYFMFDMPMYQFYINMRALPSGWVKAFAYTWEMDPDVGDYNWIRGHELQSFERFPTRHHKIERAGWHFTFLGGADAVRAKLGSYSHSERWQRTMLQAGQIERQLTALRDVGGGRFLEFCRVDDTFPKTVREFGVDCTKAGLLKDIDERVRELEGEAAIMDRERRTMEARLRYQEAELDRGIDMSPFAANLALNKSATQSSISAWSHGQTCEDDARGGNNGMISGSYGFHTEKEREPWWQVDLEEVFEIREIRIYNRSDNTAARLRHLSLLSSLNGADWQVFFQKTDDNIFDAGPLVARIEPAVQARFVRVRLDGTDYLHFDECCIYGRPTSASPGDRAVEGVAPPPIRVAAPAHSAGAEAEAAFSRYLEGPGPYKLEIGRSNAPRPTWVTVDLHPAVPGIIRLDATTAIPAPDNSFDYIYCEHMIEHVPFRGGVAMLTECSRILRPGGVVRVVTPSIAFLLSVIAPDRNSLQEVYLEWSVRRFVPDAPSVTPAFFLNSFMRSWGHTFIYDHATLRLALKMAGFDSVTEPRIGQSRHAELCGLEDEGRMPPGYLELESMILEGTKCPS